MSLQETVSIGTGGGRSLGKALSEAIPQGIVQRFLAEGINVAIAEINEEAGKETDAGLKHLGSIRFFHVDISDEDLVKKLI